jgi:HD-like signal output (HDOD) protein
MNTLKKYYIDLINLPYSEENIAELFSIANNIIKFLKSKNPSRKTNKALHFVTLTKEREFENFKYKQLDNLEAKFKDAKTNLMMDLSTYCMEYWDPLKDPWNK